MYELLLSWHSCSVAALAYSTLQSTFPLAFRFFLLYYIYVLFMLYTIYVFVYAALNAQGVIT